MYLYHVDQMETRTPVLVREKMVSGRNTIFNSPEKIVDMFNTNLGLSRKAEEYLYLLCADIKMHVTGIFEISHGTVSASLVSPREIFVRACLSGATYIVLAHNHPSGDPTPSKEDISVCERIKQAGKLMDIGLVDIIIVGDGRYYSLRESGQC